MQGDEAAQRIFERFGRALGMLMADLVNILDFDVYVIGGGVIAAWDAFSRTMFKEMRERSVVYAATTAEDPLAKKEGAAAQVTTSTGKKTLVTPALLGGDAGLFGGARLATM
jgi:glucokinase